MRNNHVGKYPENWLEIADRVKRDAGNRCERCGRYNDHDAGYTLTVHHLDCDKSNCQRWNLAALCQRCHLKIQGKVNIFQTYMFEHSPWFIPHLEGFWVSQNMPSKTGQNHDREGGQN